MLPGGYNWEEVEFEWDRHNQPKLEQEGYHRKRGRPPVYRDESEEVFYNFPVVMGPYRVRNEERWNILGSTDSGRLLFAVFLIKQGRAPECPKVRLISARDMEASEVRLYEKTMEELEDGEEGN